MNDISPMDRSKQTYHLACFAWATSRQARTKGPPIRPSMPFFFCVGREKLIGRQDSSKRQGMFVLACSTLVLSCAIPMVNDE